MGTHIICPSGLAGEIRGLKGREMTLLSDRQAARSGMFMDNLLSACWVNTTDPGPYQAREDGTVPWQQVLLGDRFYAMLRMRVATLGPEYSFKAQCPSSVCRCRFDWEIDLLKDLPVKPLHPNDLIAFKEGNRLEGVLPDACGDLAGRKFWFKLLVGADETRFIGMRGKQASLTQVLLARVAEIEGVPTEKRREWFDDAEFLTLKAILEEMDLRDCGVNTSFDVECPECYQQASIDLPFDKSFFFPTGVTEKRTGKR